MTKDRSVYIRCIHECIQKIKRYTQGGKDEFFRDDKTQDAVIRNLEIIGQAVKDVGQDTLVATDPNIPWKQIAGTRNILAHQYLGVDTVLIWEIIERDLPGLERAIVAVAISSNVRL